MCSRRSCWQWEKELQRGWWSCVGAVLISPCPFLPAAQQSHSHKAGMEQPEGSLAFPSHQRLRDVSLHSGSALVEDTPKKDDPPLHSKHQAGTECLYHTTNSQIKALSLPRRGKWRRNTAGEKLCQVGARSFPRSSGSGDVNSTVTLMYS